MSLIQRIEKPCACDMAEAKGLASIDGALACIADHVAPMEETEMVPLAQALGRILAEPICASCDMPRFDHAAMDGYAVRSADLTGPGPWALPVTLRCAAGGACSPALRPGTVARIFTGAPIPPGADCVVMQEEVLVHAEGIILSRRPNPGENVRRRGEEYRMGSGIVSRDRRITSRTIAAAVSGGAGSLKVRRKLRVALLVTGSEVARPGQTGLGGAQIWDVNTPMLQAELTRPDVEISVIAALPDSADGISAALSQAAKHCDLVITTGGVSVGEEDHLRAAVGAAGGEIHFSGAAIKPGKPVAFGAIRGAAWLGLPGNPLAAFVTWKIFGQAALARLAGLAGPDIGKRPAVLAHPMRRKPGRCEIRPAQLIGHDDLGRDLVDCQRPVNSGQVGGLSAAAGLVFLPADSASLPKGTLIEFLPFCAN